MEKHYPLPVKGWTSISQIISVFLKKDKKILC